MKTSPEDDLLYLTHIQDCLDRVARYTQGGREEFMADNKTQDAVLRNLQTMAESTQRLSASLKSTAPEIEWNKVAGFRNVLTHDDLPAFKQRIEAMLVSMNPT